MPSVLLLALLVSLSVSCRTRQAVVPVPVAPAPIVASPPPTYLEIANAYFDAGQYSPAADAYSLYLNNDPSAPDRDRALFRLALTHSFAASPVYDPTQAVAELRELLSSYPSSPLRPEAQLFVDLSDETDQLRSQITEREQRIAALTDQLATVQNGELEQLRADVSQRDERIHELTEQLDRLKKIDMQQRPAVNRP